MWVLKRVSAHVAFAVDVVVLDREGFIALGLSCSELEGEGEGEGEGENGDVREDMRERSIIGRGMDMRLLVRSRWFEEGGKEDPWKLEGKE